MASSKVPSGNWRVTMVDTTKIDGILKQHNSKRENMIAILLDCQEQYYYLPREVLEEISNKMDIPMTSVLSIATFFKTFSLKPIGRYPIRVCNGTACNIKGSNQLVEALERELTIKKGQTTPDLQFGLDTVNCVGCCGLAPVVIVGADVHGKVKISSIPKITKQYQAREGKNAESIQ